MKRPLFLLLILAILMIITNPDKEDFFDWVNDQMLTESESVLEGVLTNLIATPVLKSLTVRKDFVVCSLFVIEMNGEKDTYLGIFKRFVKIET